MNNPVLGHSYPRIIGPALMAWLRIIGPAFYPYPRIIGPAFTHKWSRLSGSSLSVSWSVAPPLYTPVSKDYLYKAFQAALYLNPTTVANFK